jgi:hypothetical protein
VTESSPGTPVAPPVPKPMASLPELFDEDKEGGL